MPLVFLQCKHVINYISLYGSGLLAGVVFIVVIPEATISLFQAYMDKDGNTTQDFIEEYGEHIALLIGVSLIGGFVIMLAIDKLIFGTLQPELEEHIPNSLEQNLEYMPNPNMKNNHKLANDLNKNEELEKQNFLSENSAMLRANQKDGKQLISYNGQPNEPLFSKPENPFQNDKAKKENKVLVSLIGLVFHSFVDGMSFGCASFASNQSEDTKLEIIIFIAIVMHKTPASLGLMTYMMNNSKYKKMVKYSYSLLHLL